MKLPFLQKFAQLKFAIFLLLLIACCSTIGTIIEQDQVIEYYLQTYSNIYLPGNFALSNLIIFTGFDHIYKTWWFLSLLFLFATSLTSCTYSQQFPQLKIARKCNYKYIIKEFQKSDYYIIVNNNNFTKCLTNLKKKNYNIFYQKNSIYTYKGILGRFAPIVVHISMLLILIGNTFAAFGSFNAQELIAKGEIFQIQNTVAKSFFTKIENNSIRINDFWINYGTKNNIEQFHSDLSILKENGNEIKRKTISVNFPLQYKNLIIYQTDWNITGLRINEEQNFYQLPITSVAKSKNIWIASIPNLKEKKNEITLITNNLNGNFSLYDNSTNFIGTYNIGEKINNLNIFEFIIETGLQIKVDPGIPIIYSGFGILIISSLISYLSFTQFWLTKKYGNLVIGARANRAKLNLRVEFLELTLPYLENKSKSK